MELNSVLSNKYTLQEKIGNGSFGEIFNGQCTQSGEAVAIKQEKYRPGRPYLENEYRCLRHLQGGIGIPRVFAYGNECGFNYMSMELLGANLESLLKLCKSKFSLKTVLMLADQCISRLEYVHSRLFIHRDIKPENFVIGNHRKSHVVHIIDFGLSKRFADPSTLKHIKFRDGKSLTGTARYVSINTHKGIEQSRRDDLESLGYLFVYLLKGSLPWIGLPAKTKAEKYKQISALKAGIALEELVEGFPCEFAQYLSYCRTLKFEQRPDYAWLKKGFKELLTRMNYKYDYLFDWELKRAPSNRKKNSLTKDVHERAVSQLDQAFKRESTPQKDLKAQKEKKDFSFANKLLSFAGMSYLPILDLSKKRY
jgi:casein kinase I family protein HRR25